jgi:hypothetical protein
MLLAARGVPAHTEGHSGPLGQTPFYLESDTHGPVETVDVAEASEHRSNLAGTPAFRMICAQTLP